jgi:chromosome segregation ATPase
MTARIFKLLVVFVLTVFLYNCGSSHNVIHDGKVYEVKGSEFYQAGVDVTESLSEETKTRIQEKLDTRLDLRAEEERRQEELEKMLKEQEKIQKQAEKRQAELENKQEEIEIKQEEREDARKAFIEANNKFKKEQKKYERLLEKGKLSPEEIKKWDDKIEKLKKEKDEALESYKSFFN